MNKSVSKRIRITKTGKALRRPIGVNHFRTRKSNKNLLHKKKGRSLSAKQIKTMTAY